MPVGQSWTLGSAGIVYISSSIAVKGNVTLKPGAVVKLNASGTTHYGFIVFAGGTLDAQGTATSPALITSSYDNSTAAGGTTGGTGTLRAGNYLHAVTVAAGGTVTLSHTTIHYAGTPVNGYTSTTTSPCTGGITITDSTISTFTGTAVNPTTGCASPGLVFNDNTVTGPRGITFNNDTGGQVPEIRGNTFDTTGTYAIRLDSHANPSGIDLYGTGANHFTGTGKGRLVNVDAGSVTVPVGQSWTLGSAGIVYISSSIAVKGNVTLKPGAVVKLNASGTTHYGFIVFAGGTLDAQGTATSPALITSSYDNSTAAGGTTGGTGTLRAGNYLHAVTVAAGGTVTLTHLRASYASTAIEVSWSSCTAGGSEHVTSSTFGTSTWALYARASGTCSPAVPFTFDGRSIPMGTGKVTKIAGTKLTGYQLATPSNNYGSSNPSEPCSSCALSKAGLTAQPKAADPVDTADGDYTESLPLVDVPSTGPSLSFTPTYDAQEAQAQASGTGTPSPLGWGWAYEAAMRLTVTTTPTRVTITQEDGSEISFAKAGTWTTGGCTTGTTWQCYTANVAADTATLEYNKTTDVYLLDRGAGEDTFGFTSTGAVSWIENPQGEEDTFSDGVAAGTGSCPAATGVATCTVETDPSGRSLVYELDATGQLVGVVSPSAKTWTLAYDAHGNLASVTTPTGQVTSFGYDTTDAVAALRHDLVSVTKPDGQAGAPHAGDHSTVAYDTTSGTAHLGWATSVSTPAGQTTSFSYSATTNTGVTTTTVTAPDGSVTTYKFTGGALFKVTKAQGTGQASTTTYARNAFNELPLDATASGKKTSLSFDTAGHLLSETTPGGHTTTNTYDANGNLLTSTDPMGNVTQYAYTTATDGVPAQLRYCTVEPAEYLNGVRCPAYGTATAGATTETFDATGNTLTTTDPLGRATHYAYTTPTDGVPPDLRYCSVSPTAYAKGVRCPAYGTTATGAATTAFDATGNVTSSTTPDGATTTTCFYGDACAPATAGALGLVYQVTAPSGTVTTKSYDPTGNLTGSTVSFRSYTATTATAYLATGQPYCTVAPGEYAQGVRCPATPPAADSPAVRCHLDLLRPHRPGDEDRWPHRGHHPLRLRPHRQAVLLGGAHGGVPGRHLPGVRHAHCARRR